MLIYVHTYYRTHTLILGDRGETVFRKSRERVTERLYTIYLTLPVSSLPFQQLWEALRCHPSCPFKNGETVSVWWSMPLTSLTFHFVSQNPHFLVVWVLLTVSFSQKHCLFIQFQHEFCINKNQNLPVFHVLLHVKQKSISLSYLPVRPFGYFLYSYCSFSRWDRKSWRQIT